MPHPLVKDFIASWRPNITTRKTLKGSLGCKLEALYGKQVMEKNTLQESQDNWEIEMINK